MDKYESKQACSRMLPINDTTIGGKMRAITVHHYDAFSNKPNMGNPAGIVYEGDSLSEGEMQRIALKVGFNETAFPLKSDKADLRIRYFTPGHELNLCGHATTRP
jgi:PhzF family phenazine biosynthesis protein